MFPPLTPDTQSRFSILGWDDRSALPNRPNRFYQIIDRFSPYVIANVSKGTYTPCSRVLVLCIQTALTTTWVGGSVTPLVGVNFGEPSTFIPRNVADAPTQDLACMRSTQIRLSDSPTWFLTFVMHIFLVSSIIEALKFTCFANVSTTWSTAREEYGGSFASDNARPCLEADPELADNQSALAPNMGLPPF
ncbi:hypothetical protein K439DRAFT_1622209 [Ramaria rubella]|nr:hypothetical protein K439DRAFT_1622209 [Ramaria rubella]